MWEYADSSEKNYPIWKFTKCPKSRKSTSLWGTYNLYGFYNLYGIVSYGILVFIVSVLILGLQINSVPSAIGLSFEFFLVDASDVKSLAE